MKRQYIYFGEREGWGYLNGLVLPKKKKKKKTPSIKKKKDSLITFKSNKRVIALEIM